MNFKKLFRVPAATGTHAIRCMAITESSDPEALWSVDASS